MLQIRIHGRGGQGVVTAAEMLSVAAFAQGRHAQAFPSFGSERTGAPVVAFCRIDDREIRLREPIMSPDVLINSRRGFEQLGLAEVAARFRHERLTTVPATEIALKHLGRPLPNAVLLGGFAALSGLVSLQAVTHAIHDTFSGKVADGNAAAAAEAFEYVRREIEELSRAQAG